MRDNCPAIVGFNLLAFHASATAHIRRIVIQGYDVAIMVDESCSSRIMLTVWCQVVLFMPGRARNLAGR